MSGMPSTYGSYTPEMAHLSYSAYNSYQMYPHQNMYSMYSSTSQAAQTGAADQYSMDYSATVEKTISQPPRSTYSASTKSYTPKLSGATSWVNATYSSSSDVDFRSYLLNLSKPSSTPSVVRSTASCTSVATNTSSSVANCKISESTASKTTSFQNEKPTAVVSGGSSFPTINVADLPEKSEEDPPLPPPPSSSSVQSDKHHVSPKPGEIKRVGNIYRESPETLRSIGLLGFFASSADSKTTGSPGFFRDDNNGGLGYGVSLKQNQSDSNAFTFHQNMSNGMTSQQNLVCFEKPAMNASRIPQNGEYEMATKAELPRINTGVRGLLLSNQHHKMPIMPPVGDKFEQRRISLQLTEEIEMDPSRPEKSNFPLSSQPRHFLKIPESLAICQERPIIDRHPGNSLLRGVASIRRPVLPTPEVIPSELFCQRAQSVHTPHSVSTSSAAEFNPKTIAIANAILRPRAVQGETLALTRAPVYGMGSGQTPLLVKQTVVLRAPAIRPDPQKPRANPVLQQSARETAQASLNQRVLTVNPNVRNRPEVAIVLEKAAGFENEKSLRPSSGPRQETSSPRNNNSQSWQPAIKMTVNSRSYTSGDDQIQEAQLKSHNETRLQKSPLEAHAEHILRREMQPVVDAVMGPKKNCRTGQEFSEKIKISFAPESETSRQFDGAFSLKSFDTYSEKHVKEKVNVESKITEARSIGNLFQPLNTQKEGKAQHSELNSNGQRKNYNDDSNGLAQSSCGIRMKVFNDFAAEENKVELCSVSNNESNNDLNKSQTETSNTAASSLKTSDNIFGNKLKGDEQKRDREAIEKVPSNTPGMIGIDLNIHYSQKFSPKAETSQNRKLVSRFSNKASTEETEENFTRKISET